MRLPARAGDGGPGSFRPGVQPGPLTGHLPDSTGEQRQRRGLRLIGYAFAALATYLLAQSTVVLAAGYRPRHSVPGMIWTAVTAAVMFALAAGKARTGRALGNPVLKTEGSVTAIDGFLAVAVLLGLVLNALAGWWQADPAAGYVLVYYVAREVRISSSQAAKNARPSGQAPCDQIRDLVFGTACPRTRPVYQLRSGPLGATEDDA